MLLLAGLVPDLTFAHSAVAEALPDGAPAAVRFNLRWPRRLLHRFGNVVDQHGNSEFALRTIGVDRQASAALVGNYVRKRRRYVYAWRGTDDRGKAAMKESSDALVIRHVTKWAATVASAIPPRRSSRR